MKIDLETISLATLATINGGQQATQPVEQEPINVQLKHVGNLCAQIQDKAATFTDKRTNALVSGLGSDCLDRLTRLSGEILQ